MKGAGFNFSLSDPRSDRLILQIESKGRNSFHPKQIVFNNRQERWVIVTLLWQKRPHLGIRWFFDNAGFPNTRGNANWFILPELLWTPILNSLPLDENLKGQVFTFLGLR